MWRRLRMTLEMIRFGHTLFALPFAVLSALLAWNERAHDDSAGGWRWREVAGILVCMVCARSAAMAFNRLVDRRLDAANPRTRSRHLPAGLLSPGFVGGFAIACGVGFVAGTALFLPNRWPLYLSAPVLAFLLLYSFTKRFTSLAHFWLGTSLMLAPVAAWIAILGRIDSAPLLLGAAVLFWVAGFDIIYACQDAGIDLTLGLRSMPAKLGVAGALRLAAACHVIMLGPLLAMPAVVPSLGWIFCAGVLAVASLLVYEHWLVRPDDLSRVNQAFFHVNSVVSLGLLAVGAIDLWV